MDTSTAFGGGTVKCTGISPLFVPGFSLALSPKKAAVRGVIKHYHSRLASDCFALSIFNQYILQTT
jgi:hypothetical protein